MEIYGHVSVMGKIIGKPVSFIHVPNMFFFYITECFSYIFHVFYKLLYSYDYQKSFILLIYSENLFSLFSYISTRCPEHLFMVYNFTLHLLPFHILLFMVYFLCSKSTFLCMLLVYIESYYLF